MSSLQENDDKLVWNFNNKGRYTVKLANKYDMETLVNDEQYRISVDWMRMWKIRVSQRRKVFLWRELRGVLPTHVSLQVRGIPCSDICPHCEST